MTMQKNSVDGGLQYRRRSPTTLELQSIPWLALLGEPERLRALAALQVADHDSERSAEIAVGT